LSDYEVVYIFHPSLEDERIEEKIERFHGMLTGERGGEITAVDHWGKRPLAYEIADQTTGHYTWPTSRPRPRRSPSSSAC
jgi:small subunit ribosomal protein S6